MSARTEQSPLTEGQQRTRRRRPVTLHAFPVGAAEAARAMGVQARATCGVWMHPAGAGTYSPGGSHSHVPTRVCGNCARIAAARGVVLMRDA